MEDLFFQKGKDIKLQISIQVFAKGNVQNFLNFCREKPNNRYELVANHLSSECNIMLPLLHLNVTMSFSYELQAFPLLPVRHHNSCQFNHIISSKCIALWSENIKTSHSHTLNCLYRGHLNRCIDTAGRIGKNI